MGSASSRLKAPLVPQKQPMRATRSSVVRQTPVSLSVDLTGMNTTFRIVDAHSGVVFHDLTPHEDSEFRTVRSANNVPIATLEPKTKNNKVFAVYDGSDTSVEPAFYIRIHEAPGYPPVVYVEFKDVSTGEDCRIFVEGEPEDRVMLVCFQRGTTFEPFEKEKNERNPNVAFVGRIRRPKTDGVVFEGRERVFIEAEAGVDLTLLTMLWCVRYELYFKRVFEGSPYDRRLAHDTRARGAHGLLLRHERRLETGGSGAHGVGEYWLGRGELLNAKCASEVQHRLVLVCGVGRSSPIRLVCCFLSPARVLCMHVSMRSRCVSHGNFSIAGAWTSFRTG